jgi:hypothetical protein
MTDELRRMKEDLSFMRELATDDGRVLEASGVGLIVAGVAFGLLMLRATLIDHGWITWPDVLTPLMPFDGLVLFFVILLATFFRMAKNSGMTKPPNPNAASRAMWAAWAAAGAGYGITQIGLTFAGDSSFTVVPLFAFWGAGWFVVWAIYRHAWQLVVTIACFAAVIVMGLVYATPYRQVVLSIGFFALVAAPGYLVYRQAKALG